MWHVIYLHQLHLYLYEQAILKQFWVCYSLQITIRDAPTVSSVKASLKKYADSRL